VEFERLATDQLDGVLLVISLHRAITSSSARPLAVWMTARSSRSSSDSYSSTTSSLRPPGGVRKGIGVRAGSRSAVWAPQDRDGQKQVLLPAVENAALAPS